VFRREGKGLLGAREKRGAREEGGKDAFRSLEFVFRRGKNSPGRSLLDLVNSVGKGGRRVCFSENLAGQQNLFGHRVGLAANSPEGGGKTNNQTNCCRQDLSLPWQSKAPRRNELCWQFSQAGVQEIVFEGEANFGPTRGCALPRPKSQNWGGGVQFVSSSEARFGGASDFPHLT